MHKDETVYLGHMLDHARMAIDMASGVSKTDYEHNVTLRFALVHAIQIIGEAARRVSEVTRAKHPDIEWPLIVGMRHKVVHDYLDVDYDIVWEVVTKDLPRLVESLQSMFPDD
jgi:uncharacterized protein with HEPN domain